ncbi:hypothetical protein [Altererythrobacter lauratis]|uniref:Uncharacterized protein n=1 Tax=Alteraurantiacibacter lauratis TaxID=2054627 RepID=A0ABV7EAB8_9SPHN
MAKRRKGIVVVLGLIVLVVLALAWMDGGVEEQRLIEVPVDLPPASGEPQA